MLVQEEPEARQSRFAFLAALGVISALGVAWLWLSAPRGRDTLAEGVITSIGLSESEFGSTPTATVQAPDRMIRVGLPAVPKCRRGERVTLVQRQTGFGRTYRLAPNACR